MLYPINEVFFSIQGEGISTGKQAVFIRFSGCNRSCSFCDTPDETRLLLSPERLAQAARDLWPYPDPFPSPHRTAEKDLTDALVILTGGEPLIRDLRPLLVALRKEGFTRIHVETNGDKLTPPGPASDFPWGMFSFLSIAPKWGHGPEGEIDLESLLPSQVYTRQILAPFEIKLLIGPGEIGSALLRKKITIIETAYPGASRYWLIPIDPGGRKPYLERIRKILSPLTREAWRYPSWSIGLQAHKLLEIP